MGILLGSKLNCVLTRGTNECHLGAGRRRLYQSLLYYFKCVEHLNSLYLKAEHLANCGKVILCLSRERAQMSGVLALFPSHGKENSLLPKKSFFVFPLFNRGSCPLRLLNEYMKSVWGF